MRAKTRQATSIWQVLTGVVNGAVLLACCQFTNNAKETKSCSPASSFASSYLPCMIFIWLCLALPDLHAFVSFALLVNQQQANSTAPSTTPAQPCQIYVVCLVFALILPLIQHCLALLPYMSHPTCLAQGQASLAMSPYQS